MEALGLELLVGYWRRVKGVWVNYFRGVFSESSEPNAPSFGRVASGIALATALVWVTRIVWRTNMLPDFYGVGFFVAVLYGLSKTSTALSDIFNKK